MSVDHTPNGSRAFTATVPRLVPCRRARTAHRRSEQPNPCRVLPHAQYLERRVVPCHRISVRAQLSRWLSDVPSLQHHKAATLKAQIAHGPLLLWTNLRRVLGRMRERVNPMDTAAKCMPDRPRLERVLSLLDRFAAWGSAAASRSHCTTTSTSRFSSSMAFTR